MHDLLVPSYSTWWKYRIIIWLFQPSTWPVITSWPFSNNNLKSHESTSGSLSCQVREANWLYRTKAWQKSVTVVRDIHSSHRWLLILIITLAVHNSRSYLSRRYISRRGRNRVLTRVQGDLVIRLQTQHWWPSSWAKLAMMLYRFAALRVRSDIVHTCHARSIMNVSIVVSSTGTGSACQNYSLIQTSFRSILHVSSRDAATNIWCIERSF